MIRTATVDRVVWERAIWIATDPGLAIEQHRRAAAIERTTEDTDGIDSALARAETDERNLPEALGKLSGVAQDVVIGRLQEVSDRKAALAQRRAEIELTRLALERESLVLRGWLDQWADNIEEMQTMDFEGRKLRLAQMGIEATVRPKSAGEDRIQVVLNLPFDASLLRRDPERPNFNWTAQHDDDYERFIRLYSVPESPDPNPTPDSQRRSSGAGNSR